MKHVVLSVLMVAALAAPSIAEEAGTTANNLSQTGAQVQETRTNPDTASLAPGGGLTISGTVESWNDQEIVIRTNTGIEHVVIQPSTQRPGSFTAGQAVTIDYNRSSQNGVMIAEQIRLGEAPAVTATTSTTGTIGDGIDQEGPVETAVEDAVADVGEAADQVGAELSKLDDQAEEEIEEETGTNLDNDSTVAGVQTTRNTVDTTADMDDDTQDTLTTSLPATAGDSPLVALLGLVALGAAAGLRRLF
jgi:hypothetical protein